MWIPNPQHALRDNPNAPEDCLKFQSVDRELVSAFYRPREYPCRPSASCRCRCRSSTTRWSIVSGSGSGPALSGRSSTAAHERARGGRSDSVGHDLDITPALLLSRNDFADAVRYGRDVRQQLALVHVLIAHRDLTHFE